MSEPTIPFGDWPIPSAQRAKAVPPVSLPLPVPLKMSPQYGVFLWWPVDPGQWAHPDDIEIVRKFVPGRRVFCREQCLEFSDRELGFVAYHFGKVTFRARPIMWLELNSEGYLPGDRVEVKSNSGQTRPRVVTIAEVLWDGHKRRIDYVVSSRGMEIPRAYRSTDLRPAPELGAHLSQRHRELESVLA